MLVYRFKIVWSGLVVKSTVVEKQDVPLLLCYFKSGDTMPVTGALKLI